MSAQKTYMTQDGLTWHGALEFSKLGRVYDDDYYDAFRTERKCRFCNDYADIKQEDKKAVKRLNKNREKLGMTYRRHIKVAIESRTRVKMHGKWMDKGVATYSNYVCKYCPSCGKKL